MFKEINYIFRRVNIVADAIITAMAFIASMFITSYANPQFVLQPEHVYVYAGLFYFVIFLWPVLLNINGLYPTNRLRTWKETTGILLKTSFHGLVILFAALYLFKLEQVSRLEILVFILLVSIFLAAKEWIVALYLRMLRRSGSNLRNVLIIGTVESAKDVVEKLERNSFLGLKIIGLLVSPAEAGRKDAWGYPILGSLDDIERVLHAYPIDNVMISTYQWENYEKIENTVAHCEEEGKEIWLPAKIFRTKIAKPDADELLDLPIFIFRTGPRFSWQVLVKIVVDRVLALTLSVLTFPIVLFAMALIKLTSPGPAIFRQKRCGSHGRTFTLYKLRTMYAGAEEELEKLVCKNIMTGPIFKVDMDPRITKVGRLLRKMSIDELPQLWNVVLGDMSLVGPRPPIPCEVNDYKGWHRRRLSMKPGITGLLQVSGRSNIVDFDKWAQLDLEYIDNWSLWLDIKIMLKTILVVLTMQGAK